MLGRAGMFFYKWADKYGLTQTDKTPLLQEDTDPVFRDGRSTCCI